MSQNNLKVNEIDDLFGHRLSDNQIMSLYPFEEGMFHKEDYNKPEFIITYDIHTAYNLRERNIPFVIWEKEYKNNLRAFVFCKSRPKATIF